MTNQSSVVHKRLFPFLFILLLSASTHQHYICPVRRNVFKATPINDFSRAQCRANGGIYEVTLFKQAVLH